MVWLGLHAPFLCHVPLAGACNPGVGVCAAPISDATSSQAALLDELKNFYAERPPRCAMARCTRARLNCSSWMRERYLRPLPIRITGGHPSSAIAGSRSQRHCVIGAMLSSDLTTRSGTRLSFTVSVVVVVFFFVTMVTPDKLWVTFFIKPQCYREWPLKYGIRGSPLPEPAPVSLAAAKMLLQRLQLRAAQMCSDCDRSFADLRLSLRRIETSYDELDP
jgi:hypothetical protein